MQSLVSVCKLTMHSKSVSMRKLPSVVFSIIQFGMHICYIYHKHMVSTFQFISYAYGQIFTILTVQNQFSLPGSLPNPNQNLSSVQHGRVNMNMSSVFSSEVQEDVDKFHSPQSQEGSDEYLQGSCASLITIILPHLNPGEPTLKQKLAFTSAL